MHLKNNIHFWSVITALSLIFVAWPAHAEEKRSPGDKVAVVNGTVITQEEFARSVSSVQHQGMKTGKLSHARLAEIKKDILEKLIKLELLYQASQNKKIKIDDSEINERFMKLRKRFPDEDKFKNWLKNINSSTAEIKSYIKREMSIQKLIEEKIVPKISVSKKETKDYYENHPKFFKQPAKVKASHILIKVDPKADESKKAEARKKLEGVQKRLKKGEDFKALAKEFSDCPSRAKGGDLGYFSRGKMVRPFEDAAFGLEPGKISDIVETRFGYHLIKVTDKKPEATTSYDDAKGRIEQYLKNKKVQEKTELYIEKLEKNAKVERFLDLTK